VIKQSERRHYFCIFCIFSYSTSKQGVRCTGCCINQRNESGGYVQHNPERQKQTTASTSTIPSSIPQYEGWHSHPRLFALPSRPPPTRIGILIVYLQTHRKRDLGAVGAPASNPCGFCTGLPQDQFQTSTEHFAHGGLFQQTSRGHKPPFF
jgi:hypothetical protein